MGAKSLDKMLFSINAKICTLMCNDIQEDNILLSKKNKYFVPIYQRPYAWREEQIQRFISDLFVSFWGKEGQSSPEKIFYGTMQLSKKNNKNEQEIIDGQQRISTLFLLFFVLKKMFPESNKLKHFNFSWFRTKVNSGKQQEYLNKLFMLDFRYSKRGSNPYQINASLIKGILEEQSKDKDDFDPDRFVSHLLSNIYFAVIETNVSLSKTLQIFNSINTTGLDLNGADVFKIRMFEYLRDIKNQGEEIFEDIDRLYRLIEDNNEKIGQKVSSMDEILQIYQNIIIAKYKLPRVLYTFGTDTFFEQLFDTILKTNIWDHFKNNVKKIDLSLKELEKIIDIRYEWQNSSYKTVEDACADSLISYSRYSRYSILIFIFLYSFKEENDHFHNLMIFLHKICKLYVIYTIRFQKAINEIHTFTYDLIDKILSGNYDRVMNLIIKKIGTLEDHKGGNDIEEILNGNIVYNKKLKDIVCRLSAMLHENYHSNKQEIIEGIQNKLFNGNIQIDIEHIQSYNDEDNNKRDDIWNEWGDDINSIGNLMILEYDINRSIQNSPYSGKVKKYSTSIFEVVQYQSNRYNSWNKNDCQERKQKEVEAILKYLFT
jgi:uncharacterized protein with ParB-like and HNH nuclease domain